MTVAAKAPKTKHYSKSESLDFRVAAAVCQKNVGESYLPKIFQLSGLSPGRVTVNKAATFDRVTEKRRDRQSSKKWKRRRLELKNSNFSSSNQKELREGVTYQSSIALSAIDEDATTSIPDMISEPKVERITDIENFVLVAFDLETTGLSDDCELTQVAAYRFDGQDTFDQYILPVGGISSGATTATGITKRNNQLFLRNRPVECKDANTALASFADWIDRQGKKVILVGHNVERFDSKHFWRWISVHNLVKRFQNLGGFIDTLPLLRSRFPKERSHKQETMYSLVVGGSYEAHNAMADVTALVKIVQALQITTSGFSNFSFSANYVEEKHKYLKMRAANSASLQVLLNNGTITKGMCQKIAGSGLSIAHLKLAFSRDEMNGIRQLFTEKFEGKARVTASKAIIMKVNSHLTNNK